MGQEGGQVGLGVPVEQEASDAASRAADLHYVVALAELPVAERGDRLVCAAEQGAVRQLPEGVEPVFVVPSGNFGNLTAGLLARLMGLPVRQFVAATNVNDVVPAYLESGSYEPRPSLPTISNAMDVGAPSNFVRMLEIHQHQHGLMADRIAGRRFDDEETRAAIRAVKAATGYVIEPHGAVAYLAAESWQVDYPGDEMIVLETAHPSKFLDVMEEELGAGAVEIPERLACLTARGKEAVEMPPEEDAFIDWLGQLSG